MDSSVYLAHAYPRDLSRDLTINQFFRGTGGVGEGTERGKEDTKSQKGFKSISGLGIADSREASEGSSCSKNLIICSRAWRRCSLFRLQHIKSLFELLNLSVEGIGPSGGGELPDNPFNLELRRMIAVLKHDVSVAITSRPMRQRTSSTIPASPASDQTGSASEPIDVSSANQWEDCFFYGDNSEWSGSDSPSSLNGSMAYSDLSPSGLESSVDSISSEINSSESIPLNPLSDLLDMINSTRNTKLNNDDASSSLLADFIPRKEVEDRAEILPGLWLSQSRSPTTRFKSMAGEYTHCVVCGLSGISDPSLYQNCNIYVYDVNPSQSVAVGNQGRLPALIDLCAFVSKGLVLGGSVAIVSVRQCGAPAAFAAAVAYLMLDLDLSPKKAALILMRMLATAKADHLHGVVAGQPSSFVLSSLAAFDNYLRSSRYLLEVSQRRACLKEATSEEEQDLASGESARI